MRYTFEYKGKQKTVEIPQEYIDQQKRSLGQTTTIKEIIDLYLFDNGYESNAEADALTVKAAGAGAGVKADRKPRKAPTRKPDDVKRELIAGLFEYIQEVEGVRDPQVTNIERMISFSLGNDMFDITLIKKRKPKT